MRSEITNFYARIFEILPVILFSAVFWSSILASANSIIPENTHDYGIDKPLKSDFEKDLNCMIDCVKVQPHLLFLIWPH